MKIQIYDCIVCKGRVGCLANSPLEKRVCNHHNEEEVKSAIKKATSLEVKG